jgi:hypothetical protein
MRFVVSLAVVALIVVWGVICLAIAVAGGLFRPRRLPSTRHLRRVRTDFLG